jgi:ubiquinone/menaquinone biosynthesis C-methylase UbiE
MKKKKRYLGWRDIDQTKDAQHYIEDLDSYRQTQSARKVMAITFELLEIDEGDHILDIGCGTGDDVRLLAEMVGNRGLVIGVDYSAVMIAEAKERAKNGGLPVDYFVADAHNLGFADNTFDGCRAVTVYDHLIKPEQAIAEMIRVARPGARIVLAEVDWGTLTVNHPDRELTRRILNYHCDNHFKNGWIGRQLVSLMVEQGLQNINARSGDFILFNYDSASRFMGFEKATRDAQKDGVISADEAESWITSLKDSGRTGHFFSALIGFIVSGQKPFKG